MASVKLTDNLQIGPPLDRSTDSGGWWPWGVVDGADLEDLGAAMGEMRKGDSGLGVTRGPPSLKTRPICTLGG
jgi:hypothetical protein